MLILSEFHLLPPAPEMAGFYFLVMTDEEVSIPLGGNFQSSAPPLYLIPTPAL